jgi:hypothetical protein
VELTAMATLYDVTPEPSRQPKGAPGGWRWRVVVSTTAMAFGMAPLFAPVQAAAAPRSFCHGTAAIGAVRLASPISLGSCPIQGRTVVMSLPGGRTAGGVSVPAAGGENINDLLTSGGEYTLRVATDALGTVSVSQSFTPSSAGRATANSPAVVAATDAACHEGAYSTNGHWAYTALQWASVGWLYNQSTESRAGLVNASTLSNIRSGNYNITTGQNNCGFATGAFAARGAYLGTTSVYANIDSSGHCTTRFPDGYNTVSWGPLYSTGSDTGLGVTCVHRINGSITEADIYLASNAGVVNDVTQGCNGQYDLQTLATHEWGHVYGLGHETSGPDEVMYPTRGPCVLRRHLGLGDYNGMISLYD